MSVPGLGRSLESSGLNAVHEIQASLEWLVKISGFYRKQRQGLDLEGFDDTFEEPSSTEDGEAKLVKPVDDKLMHEVIAECMILANHWVAKKIEEVFPERSLLRMHPRPPERKLRILQNLAKARKCCIDTSSTHTFSESLRRLAQTGDPGTLATVDTLVRNVAIFCMEQAAYICTGSCTDFNHFGLGLEFYTHFTSPIRRYADIIVHRQLIASLYEDSGSGSEIQRNIPSSSALTDHAAFINEKHKCARNAQRSAQELYQMMSFENLPEDHPDHYVRGIVFDTYSSGLHVFVPNLRLKGICYLKDTEGLVFCEASNGQGQSEFCMPETMEGALELLDFGIKVTSSRGTYSQAYFVFDTVLLKVTVLKSVFHGRRFQLNLVRKLRTEEALHFEGDGAGSLRRPQPESLSHLPKDELDVEDGDSMDVVFQTKRETLYDVLASLAMRVDSL